MCCLKLSLLVMSVVMVKAQNCTQYSTTNCTSFDEFLIKVDPVLVISSGAVPTDPLISDPCSRHEICYDCGASYNVTETQCDEDVNGTLKEFCASFSIQVIRDRCIESIPRYFTDVLKPEKEYNPAGDASYCEDPSVKDCLPSTANNA